MMQTKFQNFYSLVYKFEILLNFLDGDNRNREFAFRKYENKNTETVRFSRFNTILNKKHLEELVKELEGDFCSTENLKYIEVGGIYSSPLSCSKAIGSKKHIVSREMVMDLDITDYDDIRNCNCIKSKTSRYLCKKCWVFIELAIKWTNFVLKEYYRKKKVYFFFSGKKGFHVWVNDEDVLSESSGNKKHIIDFINPLLKRAHEFNGIEIGKYFYVNQSIQEKSEELFNYFFQKNDEHNLIKIDEGFWKIVKCTITKENIFKKVKENTEYKLLLNEKTNFWQTFYSTILELDIQENYKTLIINSILLRLLLPRFDYNVTITKNHLIKIPLSLHYDTGYIARYFDVEESENLLDNMISINDDDFLEKINTNFEQLQRNIIKNNK